MVREFSDDNMEPTLTARYDYGLEASRKIAGLTDEEVKDLLKGLCQLGQDNPLKADLYPFQEGSKTDVDIIDYDPQDPDQHHV